MNILVAGGSGFVGRRLVEALVEHGDSVTVVSRDPAGARRHGRPDVTYRGWLPAMDAFHAVVNLAGTPIFEQHWNAAVKADIRDSRVETTRTLVAAIAAADDPPEVLVNGSAIGFYGPRGAELLTESAGPGSDFLAQVCQAWEAEADTCPTRTVKLRTGVVLGAGGGALAQMLPPFKMGVGGPIGLGKAWFSWIHIDDLVGLIQFALDNEGLAGPVNGVSPGVVTNLQYTKALGRVLKRPTLLPLPPLALRVLFGEAASVLTASQRCEPEAAEKAGYTFRFPDIEPALRDILVR